MIKCCPIRPVRHVRHVCPIAFTLHNVRHVCHVRHVRHVHNVHHVHNLTLVILKSCILIKNIQNHLIAGSDSLQSFLNHIVQPKSRP